VLAIESGLGTVCLANGQQSKRVGVAGLESAIISWEETDYLHVPTIAIFRAGDHYTLFRIIDDFAQVMYIQNGNQNGTSTQVICGLSKNDQVVLHPGDLIIDGVRIRVR